MGSQQLSQGSGGLRRRRSGRGIGGRGDPNTSIGHENTKPVARTKPLFEIVLGEDSTQPIPLGVEHKVQPLGVVCFSIEFLASDERSRLVMAHEVGIGDCQPQG